MSVRNGDRAPEFVLPYRPGRYVDLSDHLGKEKVVLLFIPLAFSPVCTSEFRAIRDAWARWQELDVSVFGVSVDSPFVTQRFRDEEQIPFPILSDFNKEMTEAYGVLNEDLLGLKGVAHRSVFVMDANGVVSFDWISEDPTAEPPYETVRQAVENA